jgi:hypothetical protein
VSIHPVISDGSVDAEDVSEEDFAKDPRRNRLALVIGPHKSPFISPGSDGAREASRLIVYPSF